MAEVSQGQNVAAMDPDHGNNGVNKQQFLDLTALGFHHIY